MLPVVGVLPGGLEVGEGAEQRLLELDPGHRDVHPDELPLQVGDAPEREALREAGMQHGRRRAGHEALSKGVVLADKIVEGADLTVALEAGAVMLDGLGDRWAPGEEGHAGVAVAEGPLARRPGAAVRGELGVVGYDSDGGEVGRSDGPTSRGVRARRLGGGDGGRGEVRRRGGRRRARRVRQRRDGRGHGGYAGRGAVGEAAVGVVGELGSQ